MFGSVCWGGNISKFDRGRVKKKKKTTREKESRWGGGGGGREREQGTTIEQFQDSA